MISGELDTDGLGHIAPLDNDNVPDGNQSHFCMSCETAIVGLYCASCGQKNDDYRRSIFQLIIEVITSFTALESRIWRTWGNLIIKPGKVPREFADGRRSHWSTPVRVYLAMSIILFGFLGITQTQLISVDIDVVPKDGITKSTEDLTAEDLEISVAAHFFDTQREIDRRNADRNFDLIAKKLQGDGSGINISIGDNPPSVTKASDEVPPETNVEKALQDPDTNMTDFLDALEADNPELDLTEAKTGAKNLDVTSLTLAFVKNPSNLNSIVYTWLPRLMFFMMPFTMLIGVIFIRGRGNALMYDHLVHAAYIHAFAFLLLLVGILAGRILPGDVVFKTLAVIMLLYLPFSLKRMFKRGWIKTIWTSYGVGFIYALVLFLVLSSAVIYQVWENIISPATT